MKKISLLAAAALLTIPLAAMADGPISGTIYYTRYGAPAGQANVNKVTVNYDGATTFSLTGQAGITTTNGADGIIFAPDGDLLVGGQGNGHVSKVKISDGSITTATANVSGQYHLALSPDGTKAYATAIPGALGYVNLSPGFSNGGSITLSGSDTSITSLAFDPDGNAYYTTAGAGGTGSVGRITFSGSTATTTRILTGVPAAHGMVYDSYSGKLDLFGSHHVTQLNLDSGLTTWSDLNVTGNDSRNHAFQFDQGAPDGKGHLYVADNNGDLLFVDYQASNKVGDVSNFVAHEFLADTLDDIAPLEGLGSPAAATPEPGTFALFGALSLSGLGALARRLRRRK